jgi:hypothetical protein
LFFSGASPARQPNCPPGTPLKNKRNRGGPRSWAEPRVEDVDAQETTLRFRQEVFDDQGTLIETHGKYPVDKGHQKV